MLPDLAHQGPQALVRPNASLAAGPLEDPCRVVAALHLLREAAVHHRLGPAAIRVDIAGVVDEVDEVRSRRARADLAEHRFAVPRAVPLHVRVARPEAEGLQDRLPHLASRGQLGRVRVTQDQGAGADPLVLFHRERARDVRGDAVVGDAPVHADRLVRHVVALDELFDAHLGDPAEPGQDPVQLLARVHPVRVLGASPRDRLHDHRVADRPGCFDDLRGGGGAVVVRRPDARGVEHPLHDLLVPERQRLLDGHAGQSEHLPDARREHHVRLPQALHPVDADPAGQLRHLGEDRVLVQPRAHLHVHREGGFRRLLERGLRLVAEPDDVGADLGQSAREVAHLPGEAGGEHQNVHSITTRADSMMRLSPDRTTEVSGWRRITYPLTLVAVRRRLPRLRETSFHHDRPELVEERPQAGHARDPTAAHGAQIRRTPQRTAGPGARRRHAP